MSDGGSDLQGMQAQPNVWRPAVPHVWILAGRAVAAAARHNGFTHISLIEMDLKSMHVSWISMHLQGTSQRIRSNCIFSPSCPHHYTQLISIT